MAYRDVRNLGEILRYLGYPRTVSMESFRSPNFPLIADLLVWLGKRFDSDLDLSPTAIETEDDRVALIRAIAQFMAIKVNVKLNTKKLYQADGNSVKELLKIANLLHAALKTNSEENADARNDGREEFSIREFDISDKLHDLKQSRQLASEITVTGANLFDLLNKENELRQLRNSSVARQYEVSVVESNLKKAIEEIKKSIAETKQLTENVTQTETSLDAKIERRKVEIDRYEKRLQTLKKVRPAFLEEFTVLELELEQLFVQYSVRVRNLKHLEKLARDAERVQLERQQLAAAEQQQLLRPAIVSEVVALDGVDDDSFDATLEMEDKLDVVRAPELQGVVQQQQQQVGGGGLRKQTSRQERPRARTGGRGKNPKIYGSMNPTSSPNESSLGLSSDSDTELFLDKDEQDMIHSDDDSLAFELSEMNVKRAPSGRVTNTKIHDNSDDDF